MTALSRSDIQHALSQLADELQASSEKHVLAVMGGAALVLLYGARESTKDVDAFLLGKGDFGVLRQAAARVARSLGLPEDWLNDAAKGYVHGLALGDVVLDRGQLQIRALAPSQLLAMKLCAWRDDVDISDARLLLHKLVGTREQVWKEIEPYLVPGRELRAQYAFDDVWEAEHGP